MSLAMLKNTGHVSSGCQLSLYWESKKQISAFTWNSFQYPYLISCRMSLFAGCSYIWSAHTMSIKIPCALILLLFAKKSGADIILEVQTVMLSLFICAPASIGTENRNCKCYQSREHVLREFDYCCIFQAGLAGYGSCSHNSSCSILCLQVWRQFRSDK